MGLLKRLAVCLHLISGDAPATTSVTPTTTGVKAKVEKAASNSTATDTAPKKAPAKRAPRKAAPKKTTPKE